MKSNRKAAVAALGSAAVVIASLFVAQPAFAGGADRTCSLWKLSGKGPNGGPNILSALCSNPNGHTFVSNLALTNYLANNNGTLVRRVNGRYDYTCYREGLSGLYVTAFCRNGAGNWILAAIHVGTFTNNNGRLGK